MADLHDYLSGKTPTLDGMNELLANGAAIHEVKSYRTPLDYACLNEHTEAHLELAKCIEVLCKLDAATANNPIGLVCSLDNPNIEALKILARKYDVNYVRDNGLPPLMEACSRNNISCIKVLLEAGAKIEVGNLSALVYANSREAFNLLLDADANINALNEGRTILDHFIENHEDFAIALINRKINVETYVLFFAFELRSSISLIEELLRVTRDFSGVLETACRFKFVAVINAFLDSGVQGTNLLHNLLSVHEKKVDIRPVIRRLVNAGYNINEKIIPDTGVLSDIVEIYWGLKPMSPLQLACKNDLTDAIFELVFLGADYDDNISFDSMNSDVQKLFGLNFSQCPLSTFSLNDFWMIRPGALLRDQIITLMLCRQCTYCLPIELTEHIFFFLRE